MGTRLFGPDGPARSSDHVQQDFPPPTKEDLVVRELSRSQWRISDRRYPEHDASGLLGFIEQTGDTFELTQLEHGFEWFYFTSLVEAIGHFNQALSNGSLAEPQLSWPSSSA